MSMAEQAKVTITPEEAEKVLRGIGVHIEAATIRDGIEQGVFSFGIMIVRSKRIFLISKKKFIEWVDDFCGVQVAL